MVHPDDYDVRKVSKQVDRDLKKLLEGQGFGDHYHLKMDFTLGKPYVLAYRVGDTLMGAKWAVLKTQEMHETPPLKVFQNDFLAAEKKHLLQAASLLGIFVQANHRFETLDAQRKLHYLQMRVRFAQDADLNLNWVTLAHHQDLAELEARCKQNMEDRITLMACELVYRFDLPITGVWDLQNKINHLLQGQFKVRLEPLNADQNDRVVLHEEQTGKRANLFWEDLKRLASQNLDDLDQLHQLGAMSHIAELMEL